MSRLLLALALVTAPSAAPLTFAEPPIVTVGTRVLGMRDSETPGRRSFSWSVRSGLDDPAHQVSTPVAGGAGDPTPAGVTGGGAVLTVYNTAGSGESFVVVLPAGRWTQQGNLSNGPRYVYAADPGTEPIWKIWLKGSKLTVRGGKQAWGYTLDEVAQGRLGIRLTLGTGVTYCADVPARTSGNPPSSAKFDRPGRFQGQSKTPYPAACPPLP